MPETLNNETIPAGWTRPDSSMFRFNGVSRLPLRHSPRNAPRTSPTIISKHIAVVHVE